MKQESLIKRLYKTVLNHLRMIFSKPIEFLDND